MSGASKSGKSPIERVLGLLDMWRHLPAYRLEPRADVFFALYLPEVLGAHFGISVDPLLVPEFPIKKKEDNASNKVDYLALQRGKPAKRAFLVELKTDMASRRDEQDRYLCDAVERGLKELVMGVIQLCRASDQKAKYVHLLKLLSRLDLVTYEDTLFPVQRGFSKILDRVEDKVKETPKDDWPSLEVVYVQPKPPSNTIVFTEFADTIERGGADGIRSIFADHLRKWAAEVAGSPPPRDWSSP